MRTIEAKLGDPLYNISNSGDILKIDGKLELVSFLHPAGSILTYRRADTKKEGEGIEVLHRNIKNGEIIEYHFHKKGSREYKFYNPRLKEARI